MKHTIKREYELPGGGKVKITVSQDEPIDESEYLILRKDAAVEMATCLVDLGQALRPKEG